MIVRLHTFKWIPVSEDTGNVKVKQTIHVEFQGTATCWEELRKLLIEAGYEIE